MLVRARLKRLHDGEIPPYDQGVRAMLGGITFRLKAGGPAATWRVLCGVPRCGADLAWVEMGEHVDVPALHTQPMLPADAYLEWVPVDAAFLTDPTDAGGVAERGPATLTTDEKSYVVVWRGGLMPPGAPGDATVLLGVWALLFLEPGMVSSSRLPSEPGMVSSSRLPSEPDGAYFRLSAHALHSLRRAPHVSRCQPGPLRFDNGSGGVTQDEPWMESTDPQQVVEVFSQGQGILGGTPRDSRGRVASQSRLLLPTQLPIYVRCWKDGSHTNRIDRALIREAVTERMAQLRAVAGASASVPATATPSANS